MEHNGFSLMASLWIAPGKVVPLCGPVHKTKVRQARARKMAAAEVLDHCVAGLRVKTIVSEIRELKGMITEATTGLMAPAMDTAIATIL